MKKGTGISTILGAVKGPSTFEIQQGIQFDWSE